MDPLFERGIYGAFNELNKIPPDPFWQRGGIIGQVDLLVWWRKSVRSEVDKTSLRRIRSATVMESTVERHLG